MRTAALSLLGAAILAGCGAAEPKPTPVVAVVEQPPGETRAAPTPLPEPRADDPPASTDGKTTSGEPSCTPRPTKPTPPPERTKRQMAEVLLRQGDLMIHLDARRPGVVVPAYLSKESSLVLQVGYKMAVPIPDLKVDASGISGTLSFHQQPFATRVPWSAIYALVNMESKGGLWYSDVPEELYCK